MVVFLNVMVKLTTKKTVTKVAAECKPWQSSLSTAVSLLKERQVLFSTLLNFGHNTNLAHACLHIQLLI